MGRGHRDQLRRPLTRRPLPRTRAPARRTAQTSNVKTRDVKTLLWFGCPLTRRLQTKQALIPGYSVRYSHGSCAPSSYGYSNHRRACGLVRRRNHGGRLRRAANPRLGHGIACGNLARFVPRRFGSGGDRLRALAHWQPAGAGQEPSRPVAPLRRELPPGRNRYRLRVGRSRELVTTYTGTAF